MPNIPTFAREVGDSITLKTQFIYLTLYHLKNSILHIGGNDNIPTGTKGEVFADNIIQLGRKIRYVTDIETIVICGILSRAHGKSIKEEAETYFYPPC